MATGTTPFILLKKLDHVICARLLTASLVANWLYDKLKAGKRRRLQMRRRVIEVERREILRVARGPWLSRLAGAALLGWGLYLLYSGLAA